jgi:RecA-family ATPase
MKIINKNLNNIFDLVQQEMEKPEPVELWRGIVEDSFGLIAGVGKTGKTTMAENLALSFACGRKEYLGYPINGGAKKVLFLNLEESGRIRHRRMFKQFSVLSDKEKELVRQNYVTNTDDNFPEFLNTDEDWEIVKQAIDDSPAKIVFLDSVTHMAIGDIETSRVSQAFIQRLKKYILREGKTFIFIHHNVKGNDKPIDKFCIAGSRVITQSFH